MAKVAPSLCLSYIFEGNYREIVNIVPNVIALLEKTQREHEFFGFPTNIYTVLQGLYGYSMGALGEFTKGEELCEKGVSFGHKINHLFSIGVAELFYGFLFATKGDGKNAVKHLQSSIEFLERVDLGGKRVVLGLVGANETNPDALEKLRRKAMERGCSFIETIHLRGVPPGHDWTDLKEEDYHREATRLAEKVSALPFTRGNIQR
jgi:hypothetical protein